MNIPFQIFTPSPARIKPYKELMFLAYKNKWKAIAQMPLNETKKKTYQPQYCCFKCPVDNSCQTLEHSWQKIWSFQVLEDTTEGTSRSWQTSTAIKDATIAAETYYLQKSYSKKIGGLHTCWTDMQTPIMLETPNNESLKRISLQYHRKWRIPPNEVLEKPKFQDN